MEDFLDLPEALRPVAQKHGRELFGLVHGTGMAREAVKVLGRHQVSKEANYALAVLAGVFNQLATGFARSQGWDEAVLVQCEKDIEIAWASEARIILPPEH